MIQQGDKCECASTSAFVPHTKSASERGYDASWDEYSRQYRKIHPYCVACEAAGFVTPACLVDHIVPFHVNGAIDEQLRRDPANHQSLCDHRFRDCHNKLKKPLEAKYRGEQRMIRKMWERLLEELSMSKVET
jgi:5-methylcytosine-specific restriction protein A